MKDIIFDDVVNVRKEKGLFANRMIRMQSPYIKLDSVYDMLVGLYALGDYSEVKDYLYMSPLVAYYVMRNAEKLKTNEDDRNVVFENKSKTLLLEYISSAKGLDWDKIEEYRLLRTDFYKTKDASVEVCALIECMFAPEEYCDIDFPECLYGGLSMLTSYLQDAVCPEEFTGMFNSIFQEELKITKFDLFEKSFDSIVFAYDKSVEELEYYSTPECLMNSQILLGEKLGQWIYDARNYAIKNDNIVPLQNGRILASGDKIEPFSYLYCSLNKYLNSLILTQHDNIFDTGVLECSESYITNGATIEFFVGTMYGRGIRKMIGLMASDSAWAKKVDSLQNRAKSRDIEVQIRLYNLLKSYGLSDFISSSNISREFKMYLLKNAPEDIERYIDSELISVMYEDQTFLNCCKDEKTLRLLLRQIEFDKWFAMGTIRDSWSFVNKKAVIKTINKLKVENKGLNISTNYSDEVEFVNIVHNVYKYIQDNKIKNKSVKEFLELLESKISAGVYKLDGFNLSDAFLAVKQYYESVELEEKINAIIFELLYKDQIEEMKKDAERQIQEFKSKFFKAKSYDFDRFYRTFCDRLFECAGKERFDFEEVKNSFENKFEEIVNNFKPKEIKDNLATAEYLYFLLKEQKMELTPIFVGVLKAVEQFMCSFVNYLIKQNKTNSRKIDGFDIFSVNWKKITGAHLEDFIDNNFLKYDVNVDFDLKERFRTLIHIWRNDARNGNVHKDNVYSLSRVENYVDSCYRLIAIMIFTVL